MGHRVVPKEDSRLHVEDLKYHGETGDVKAHFAMPKEEAKLPGVVVICEIWGLVDHIKEVARRVALEGFLVIAPDALSPLGGTPEDLDKKEIGEVFSLIRKLDDQETIKNFVAAEKYLETHPQSTGKVGVMGFCWGGGLTNQLAVNSSDFKAAVPFYGRQPAPEDVPKIKTPLLIHYASDDERTNEGIPAFEAALQEAAIDYQIFMYEGTKHGFFNNTRPIYHEEAAKLAWKRTIDFFKQRLKI